MSFLSLVPLSVSVPLSNLSINHIILRLATRRWNTRAETNPQSLSPWSTKSNKSKPGGFREQPANERINDEDKLYVNLKLNPSKNTARIIIQLNGADEDLLGLLSPVKL